MSSKPNTDWSLYVSSIPNIKSWYHTQNNTQNYLQFHIFDSIALIWNMLWSIFGKTAFIRMWIKHSHTWCWLPNTQLLRSRFWTYIDIITDLLEHLTSSSRPLIKLPAWLSWKLQYSSIQFQKKIRKINSPIDFQNQ